MKTVTAVLAIGLVFAVSGCSQGTYVPTIKIAVKGVQLQVELAQTEAERERGLQERKTLAENAGMLFIFQVPGKVSFWMDKTLIPLSIAYIDDSSVILQLEDMEPMTRTGHPSEREDVSYALEVNKGWFDKHKVKVGDKVDLSQLKK